MRVFRPFWPSWNSGGPGWYTHSSSASVKVFPHPLCTHFCAMMWCSDAVSSYADVYALEDTVSMSKYKRTLVV